MGNEISRVNLVAKEYEIVGTIRQESSTKSKKVTYDGLLELAREKYGKDVDIMNIKIDTKQKKGLFSKKQKPYLIINAYVIKYF